MAGEVLILFRLDLRLTVLLQPVFRAFLQSSLWGVEDSAARRTMQCGVHAICASMKWPNCSRYQINKLAFNSKICDPGIPITKCPSSSTLPSHPHTENRPIKNSSIHPFVWS
jgi:hypothetical protein